MAMVDAIYTSVWDGGIRLESKCKVNTKTKEIKNIKSSYDIDVEVLDREFVTIDGKEYDACREDELMYFENRDEMYWYK